MASAKNDSKYYMGVDVGGTKILAALAKPSGKIVASKRCSMPRQGGSAAAIAAITGLMSDLLDENGGVRRLEAIGLAVPGTVSSDGTITFSPNTSLGGLKLRPRLEKRFGVPVEMGNDVNVGTMGEKWLGAGSAASSVVGIFVGTGIGGGIIIDNKLVTGWRGAAAEIGHMQMQLHDGPKCGCKAFGCLEALASRTAIEREIRRAIRGGAKSLLTELVGKDLSRIRSGSLKKALEKKDRVVCDAMRSASEVIAKACINIRHLLDPELIILGGGVIEACGFFMMPIINRVLAADTLAAGTGLCKVVPSLLGDDAVVLGAVAMAQQAAGKKPLKKAIKTRKPASATKAVKKR